MSQVKFLKGLKANLSTIPIIEGQLIITLDEKKIYLDKAGTTDTPGAAEDRIILGDVSDLLALKQDILEFATPYNATTNKAATIADITNAVGDLSGAMHFVGVSITNPTDEDGPTITDYTKEFKTGDVCIYGNKEFVYDGTNWKEFGDETIYAIKGSIADADIAANANIAQSKINGLPTDLDAIRGTAADTAESVSIAGAKKYTDAKLTWGTF